MASLDQSYTITLDTAPALAQVAELNAKVDEVLAKLERAKQLAGECEVTITCSGRDLAKTLNIETDRLGRVLGK